MVGERNDLVMHYSPCSAASFPASFELPGAVTEHFEQVELDLRLTPLLSGVAG